MDTSVVTNPISGFHPDFLRSLPAADYHSHPATGHSSLVRIMRSPAHYQEYATHPPEPTVAMQLGTAFHTALLEWELFGKTFVVAPKFDRRTKAGKAEALAWETGHTGKIILTPDQMEAIGKMVLAVREHKGARRLLGDGLAETSGFWRDERTGIECKMRPDFLAAEGETIAGIVDIKTCVDASANGFSRAIATQGYDVQAAFYQDGMKTLSGETVPFYFIAIEKEAPYALAVYQASQAMLEIGREKYRAALELLSWCRRNNFWPSYQPGGEIETIDLPRWAANFSLDG